MMSEKTVLVQIPASTSNCGAGFDTLSIALSLYNFVRVTERADHEIRPVGELVPSTQIMVERAAEAFAAISGAEAVGFDYEIWGEVPRARGLGSSSTVRAGVLAGLNRLAGEPMEEAALIRLTAELDNAPDNACAAFAGGFCIARTEPADFSYREHVRFELPEELNFLAVSPNYEVLTEDSRLVLPRGIAFDDVVRSANSLAYFVGVMVSGNYARLKDAVNDYIHQPYREKLNPFGRESIEAGCHAGAYAGWLSGSGSTVLCVSDDAHAAGVGAEMQMVYEANGVQARVYRLHADNDGLKIV